MNASDILHHITVCGKPDDMVETINGTLTYRAWLDAERDRIRGRTGWPVEVITNPATGEISLVHLRVRKA